MPLCYCKIELIECKICETKLDRWAIERYHILNTLNCVNICQPGRTHAQYRLENKQLLLEKQNQYYQNNKEQVDRKRQEKFICPCGGRYSKANKSQHFKSQKHLSNI